MEYYRNQLCATFEELTSGDDPVIKEGTLRQNVKRKNIECANRGGGEGNIVEKPLYFDPFGQTGLLTLAII